jgi:hypothetical protein
VYVSYNMRGVWKAVREGVESPAACEIHLFAVRDTQGLHGVK